MKLVLLGKPISVNALYRGRRFLTPIGKSTKEDYFYQAKSQYKGKPLKCPVKLQITIYVPNHASDLDNTLKAVFDCLTGVLWVDDKQIIEIHAFKVVSKENPRVELSVSPLQ